MRLLTLTLSVTVHAVTTVLAAFMAGLALGAAWGGRVADRVGRPLAAYALVELGLAATGAATPAVLFRLPPVYVWLHDRLGGSALAFGAARFGLAAGVLLVPCTLMGATLPLIARAAIARADGVGRGAGALYAANTLGAVLGCVAAGFVLVPRLGLAATSVAAAAVNVAVGVVAFGLGRRTTAARTAARAVAVPAPARLVMLAFGLSGFTALGYEVLWTRALVHYTHNSTYAYSAMLAVFLLGLALGSAALGAVTDRLRRPLLALGAVEILTGASVVGGLALYARYDRLVPAAAAAMGGLGSWPRVVALVFGEAGAALLPTTLLLGATFPLVARLVVGGLDGLGTRLGAAYVWNTVGSILGAVVAGFGLLPAPGMRGAFLTRVVGNLVVGTFLALPEGPRAGTMAVRGDRMYAHIPLLLRPGARRVLNICFGVGNSLAAVAAHPIERVDAVELSPGVVDAAGFFRGTNHDVLADPRVQLTIADGRNFLLASHERWDVIRLDPPELHTAGVVSLYTREFYALARDHPAPGGLFSIWVNVVMTPEAELRLLVRTVASVFPQVSVWRGPLRYSWVINGSLGPHGPDLALLARRFAEPRVQGDLAEIGVPDPFAFLAHFVLAGGEVAAFAGAGPVASDDSTRLDFPVPRSLDPLFGFANASSGGWLVDLMEPGARHDVGLAVFWRKLARMQTFARPVLPYLSGLAESGLTPEEVAARIAAAGAPVAAVTHRRTTSAAAAGP